MVPWALDATAVALFVGLGRSAHHHGGGVGGFASTAWPFACGLLVGWALTGRRAPTSPATGALVAAATVGAGMVLRVVAGQGTAGAFIAVAAGFLGACMVGGRVALAGAGGRLARPRSVQRGEDLGGQQLQGRRGGPVVGEEDEGVDAGRRHLRDPLHHPGGGAHEAPRP